MIVRGFVEAAKLRNTKKVMIQAESIMALLLIFLSFDRIDKEALEEDMLG